MEAKKLKFGGHELSLYPGGELYWEKNEVLVISDLHLEKSSYFRESGQFIPPYDTFDTLEKLEAFKSKKKVSKIIFLGDLIHDRFALSRIREDQRERFLNLISEVESILTLGNHDEEEVLSVNLGLKICDSLVIEGLHFNHQPKLDIEFQIFGHFHPKVNVNSANRKMWKKCFLKDNNNLLMPSYGTFTGGLDISNTAIEDLFSKNSSIYPITKNRIFMI